MNSETNVLIICAHAADFVWRSGGTIAQYTKANANVSLVVLSFGSRGESNDLWKIDGQTLERVKKIRRAEAEKAAAILGVKDVEFWDLHDYPMPFEDETINRLVRKMREVKPHIIITHSKNDAFNPDHENVSKAVTQAGSMANAAGVRMEGLPNTKQAMIFGYEPHQSEVSLFMPDVLIDITETYELKVQAMECFKAQKDLISYYKIKAEMRGNHARRWSGNSSYKQAEAFTRYFPYVGSEFK